MAEIIAVMSPKGGVGKTFIASTLSLCLAKLGHRVLVVDTDLHSSNLSIYLGMSNITTSLNDVIKYNSPVEKAIFHFNSMLDILPATTSIELEEVNFNIKFLRDLFFKLSKHYDFIIVDTKPGFSKNNKVVASLSDKILLVSTPDIPTLMTTHKLWVMLRSKHFAKQQLNSNVNAELVLNKVTRAYYELRNYEVEELMDIRIAAVVPFDRRVLRAVALRIELKGGRAFNAILKLARSLSESSNIHTKKWLKGLSTVNPEKEKPHFKHKTKKFLFFRF